MKYFAELKQGGGYLPVEGIVVEFVSGGINMSDKNTWTFLPVKDLDLSEANHVIVFKNKFKHKFKGIGSEWPGEVINVSYVKKIWEEE